MESDEDMSRKQLESIRSDAMLLSDHERAALAHELVRSLDGPEDQDAAEAWGREIVERLAQLDAGGTEMIDRATFRQHMKKALASR